MGLYTLNWLLIEANEGLDERELIRCGVDYWSGEYGIAGIEQIFCLPDLHTERRQDCLRGCPRHEPIALREYLGEKWPPAPASYRSDPERFAGLLAQLKALVVGIEETGERRYH